MRPVLARRIVVLRVRKMFDAINGAEAQEQESNRYLANSVLHREQGLFERCKAWTFPRAI